MLENRNYVYSLKKNVLRVVISIDHVYLLMNHVDWKFVSFNAPLLFIRWLLHHQAVVQLSLKAVSQTAQLREETVYAKLMEAEKV